MKTIDKPATKAETKRKADVMKALEKRDADIAAQEKADKAKAKAAKGKFAKSKQGKQSAAEKEKEKAVKAAEREQKRADKAKAEKAAAIGDHVSKAKARVLAHNAADIDANDARAVAMATEARKTLMTKVIGAKCKDAYLLTRVSGRGVTLVPFKAGTNVLAMARGQSPDENGKFPQATFDLVRRDYNDANDKFNAWMTAVEDEKARKLSVKASPKKSKGARSATVTKSAKVSFAKLTKLAKGKKGMALIYFDALLDVADTSERLLNLGAARLVNDVMAFTRADESKARGKWGRHLANLRSNSRLSKPSYASATTIKEIEKKGDDKMKAAELFSFIMTDAKKWMLNHPKKLPMKKDPVE